MSTPQFKTFDALCLYAATRAAKSAKRNDPIAWAYWKETERWARLAPTGLMGSSSDYEVAKTMLRTYEWLAYWDSRMLRYQEAAVAHSRVKWCAAILRAHGSRVKVSLDWMREVK